MAAEDVALREVIQKFLQEGRTQSEISRLIGRTRQRVSQIISSMEIPDPPRRSFRKKHRPPRSQVLGEIAPGRISTGSAGTATELLVAADLAARGWHVFLPVIRTTRCDIVVVSPDGRRVLRIEVRPGKRLPSGVITFARKRDPEHDHYAVALQGEPILYEPEIPEAIFPLVAWHRRETKLAAGCS